MTYRTERLLDTSLQTDGRYCCISAPLRARACMDNKRR